MAWVTLFERAETYETTVAEIRETLAEHRRGESDE